MAERQVAPDVLLDRSERQFGKGGGVVVGDSHTRIVQLHTHLRPRHLHADRLVALLDAEDPEGALVDVVETALDHAQLEGNGLVQAPELLALPGRKHNGAQNPNEQTEQVETSKALAWRLHFGQQAPGIVDHGSKTISNTQVETAGPDTMHPRNDNWRLKSTNEQTHTMGEGG